VRFGTLGAGRRGYTWIVITLPADGTVPYRALHKYLNGRYADTVVLTFGEIEDLLGFVLPDIARVRVEWWTQDTADGGESPQSYAWMHAGRTAKPNLFARTVVFERVPS
jgi:hypothetical protein